MYYCHQLIPQIKKHPPNIRYHCSMYVYFQVVSHSVVKVCLCEWQPPNRKMPEPQTVTPCLIRIIIAICETVFVRVISQTHAPCTRCPQIDASQRGKQNITSCTQTLTVRLKIVSMTHLKPLLTGELTLRGSFEVASGKHRATPSPCARAINPHICGVLPSMTYYSRRPPSQAHPFHTF